MTDAQFWSLVGVLISLIGTIVQAFRWAVRRVTGSIDKNTAKIEADTEGKVALAREMATLSAKIDGIADAINATPRVRARR